MKKGLLFTAFSILLFTACNNAPSEANRGYIAKIDSLNTELDAAAKMYDSIGVKNYVELSKEVSNDYKYITENLVPTEENKNFFTKDLTTFKATNKTLKKLVEKDALTLEAIDYSKTQLADLKKSIQNNEFKDSLITEYYTTEANAVKSIVYQVEEYKRVLNLWMPQLDTIHEKVKKEIAILKEQSE